MNYLTMNTQLPARIGFPLLILTTSLFAASTAIASSPKTQVPVPLKVTVNSNQDGAIQPDDKLTLREAIQLVNGTLSPDQLSDAEKAQIQVLGSDATARIEFNLPADQATIYLVDVLPPLARVGLVLDGTSQPGYNAGKSAINEIPMPVPVVAITPAQGKEIFRGLTVIADGITIRGLSIYGFTSVHKDTAGTPPADIFISHRLPPPDISKQPTPANFAPYYDDDFPPKDTIIENNWLGMPPNLSADTQPLTPDTRSAFGVSVFNATGTVIRRNWIANHDGSAIITSVKAEGMRVEENVLTGNGVAGMPDAIRLDGKINQSRITANLICGNDGSGVYLFKPDGATQIDRNQIIYNGRRFRKAAVYLMGSQHQVKDNEIRYQAGPGVVVAAYPKSQGNLIQVNRFSNLEGLSIDLVTQENMGVYDYQRGDGPNPMRNTSNRRLETGNAAINAPQFVTQEFIALSKEVSASGEVAFAGNVEVFGTADPGSAVEIYRVSGAEDGYGPLSEPIATEFADDKGKFHATLSSVRVGDRISATATLPNYGTSEPARTAVIRSLDPATPLAPATTTLSSIPRCVTAPEPPPEPPPPTPMRVQVPTRIHFALDQSLISPATAKVLERVAAVMLQNPALVVDIEGHTDPRATDAYNLELGKRRALAARNYLLRQGIAPERMTLRSLGERQPLSPGKTRLDYARDRRVEFIFRDARGLELIVQEEDLQIEPAGGVR